MKGKQGQQGEMSAQTCIFGELELNSTGLRPGLINTPVWLGRCLLLFGPPRSGLCCR